MNNETTPSVRKSCMSIESKAIDLEKRTITFIGTTEGEDRSGDIIELEGWKLNNFMANPVFLWSHNSFQPPIGKALAVSRTSQGLEFVIEFATKEVFEFADTIFKLYAAGFLKAVSVGFIPIKREILTDPETGNFKGVRFIEQELLELSAVSVPANPEALITEAQDGDLQKEAAAFLVKSLQEEETLIKTVAELKEMLREVKGDEMAEPTETLDIRVKKVEDRLESFEKFIEEVKANSEMQKSAVHALTLVKQLLDGMSDGEGSDNPFVKILASGIAPKGKPEDVDKSVLEAITKASTKLSKSSWTPAGS